MKKELEEKLFNDFPKLYLGKFSPITLGLMNYGFECGDGWFNLLYDLSRKIESKNDKLDNPNDYFIALQIKEKYATLRVYLNTFDKEVDMWIGEAEIESKHTCENCGSQENLKVTCSWIKTLCDKCLI